VCGLDKSLNEVTGGDTIAEVAAKMGGMLLLGSWGWWKMRGGVALLLLGAWGWWKMRSGVALLLLGGWGWWKMRGDVARAWPRDAWLGVDLRWYRKPFSL
jgi:hypothetical protein